MMIKPDVIPNLNLMQTYDKFYDNSYIQYESLDNLATFFGRIMHLHRHDQYYQLHFIHKGTVHLQLGDKEYIETAPLIFFTPPPIPHSFITEQNATGQVLTIHQSLIEQLFKNINYHETNLKSMASCVTFQNIPKHLEIYREMLEKAFEGLHLESISESDFGKHQAKICWSQSILLNLFRLMENITEAAPVSHNNSAIFREYLALIEENYHKNHPINYYVNILNTTEGQLNKICRQIANISSKRIIHERVILEAKYLLTHTNLSIQQIAFQLGFQDPAYFTRFFTKYTQTSPKNYRKSHDEHDFSSQ